MNNETAARDAEWPPIVIVATPPGYAPQRLQAVLDNGATVGVLGVLLGQWRPGVTAYVTTDGRVSATSPGLGESLRGAQVFQLPEPDAADLLALLRLAQPPPRYPEPRDPAASGRPGWQHHDEHPPTMPATHSQSRQGAGSASGDEHDPGEWDEAIASPATDLGYDEGVLEVTAPAHGGLEITGASPARRQSHPRLTSAPPPARTRPPSDDRRHEDHPRGAAIPSTADITNGQGVNGAAAGTTERACETADETATTSAPVVLTVLGPVRVHWHSPGHSDAATDPSGAAHEITASLGPRQRELLAFLAVHRDGVTRDALVAALWPDGRPDRPTNALNAILGRLRRSLAAATDGAVSEILLAGDGRYRLDPAWIEVDLWYFQDAVAARRAATTDAERIAAYRRVVAAYGGKLAEGTEAEWLDVEADAIRRDAIDAVAALARAMVEHDPAQTLELLEAARTRDPYNELLYRDIMRLQDRLGRHDAISRTLTQLTKRLADINDKPSRQAVELATQLQNRHAALADTPAAPPPRGSSTSPAATRGPRVEHHRAARATHPTAGTRHSNAINR
jgi:DNA-binding SARP family transcriptional activator